MKLGEKTQQELDAATLKATADELLNALTFATTQAEKAVVIEANQRKIIKAVAYLLGEALNG